MSDLMCSSDGANRLLNEISHSARHPLALWKKCHNLDTALRRCSMDISIPLSVADVFTELYQTYLTTHSTSFVDLSKEVRRKVFLFVGALSTHLSEQTIAHGSEILELIMVDIERNYSYQIERTALNLKKRPKKFFLKQSPLRSRKSHEDVALHLPLPSIKTSELLMKTTHEQLEVIISSLQLYSSLIRFLKANAPSEMRAKLSFWRVFTSKVDSKITPRNTGDFTKAFSEMYLKYMQNPAYKFPVQPHIEELLSHYHFNNFQKTDAVESLLRRIAADCEKSLRGYVFDFLESRSKVNSRRKVKVKLTRSVSAPMRRPTFVWRPPLVNIKLQQIRYSKAALPKFNELIRDKLYKDHFKCWMVLEDIKTQLVQVEKNGLNREKVIRKLEKLHSVYLKADGKRALKIVSPALCENVTLIIEKFTSGRLKPTIDCLWTPELLEGIQIEVEVLLEAFVRRFSEADLEVGKIF